MSANSGLLINRSAVAALGVACLTLVMPQAPAFAAGADEAATVAQIRADVVELDQAYAAADVATIKRLTLPQVISITSRYGGEASRSKQIGAFKDTKRKHFNYSTIEVQFLSPDIALVTFEKSYSGTYKGTPLPPRVFVGEIWQKRTDTWLNRFYQETRIEEK